MVDLFTSRACRDNCEALPPARTAWHWSRFGVLSSLREAALLMPECDYASACSDYFGLPPGDLWFFGPQRGNLKCFGWLVADFNEARFAAKREFGVDPVGACVMVKESPVFHDMGGHWSREGFFARWGATWD